MIHSQTLEIIQKNFDLKTETSEENILQALTQVIQYYLDNNFERLIQIMYRLDISESKFREVMAQATPQTIAENIAKLVLKREEEKYLMRQKYSQNM